MILEWNFSIADQFKRDLNIDMDDYECSFKGNLHLDDP
jgi:hypothetical protein